MRPRRSRRGSVLSDLHSTQGSGLARLPYVGAPATGVSEVSGPNIAPGAVGTVHMQPGAVDGTILAPGAFDITHFASGLRPIQIVGSLPSLPNALYPEGAHVFLTTDDKLYRSTGSTWTAAVPTTDITGTITTTQIADDAITTPKLMTGAVTADEIGANAVTAAKILADAVTAGKIAAAAITARELAAGAVTTEKLTVGLLQDSVVLNGGFEELSGADATLPAQWSRSGLNYSVLSTAVAGEVRSGAKAVALQSDAGGSNHAVILQQSAASMPVSEGETWYLSGWARSNVTATGLYIRIYWGSTAGGTDIGLMDAASNATTTSAWTKWETTGAVPAGAKWATVYVYNYIPNVTNTKYVDDITFQRAVGTANIIDAAIQNAKIGNLQVDSIKIGNAQVLPGKMGFETLATLFIFGDGVDGDVTLSSNTTLTRDMSYNNLTINGGVVLTTAGYRIFVKNTLLNNGTIRWNGPDSLGYGQTTPGLAAGHIGGSGSGGRGGNDQFSQGPDAGGSVTDGLGGAGGAGGPANGSGSYANGAGGAINPLFANRHGLQLLSDSPNVRGGGGGGGGGCENSGNNFAISGSGGVGGGVIIIAARTINNGSGIIQAKGGNGSAPHPNVTGGYGSGGGGGGGGGAVVLVYRTLTQGTITVTGGTGGSAVGTGSVGANGAPGLLLLINQEA